MSALAHTLRWALAALFVWAGAAKLVDTAAFTEEIANSHLWPALAPLLGAIFPMVELLAGLALALAPRAWRAGAALLVLLLLLAFTGAVTAAWLRGIDVRCGCFGKGGGPIDGLTVARDVVFVLWSGFVMRNAARA